MWVVDSFVLCVYLFYRVKRINFDNNKCYVKKLFVKIYVFILFIDMKCGNK